MSEPRPKYPVDIKSVMELRRLTGFGVMQCKRILEESGSVDEALSRMTTWMPPPTFISYSGFCPNCGGGLRWANQMECPTCHWLRVPPKDRAMWGTAGRCPKCGFAYRWDGTVCSHCGESTDR